MTIVKQQIQLKIPTKFKRGQQKPSLLHAWHGHRNMFYYNDRLHVALRVYSIIDNKFKSPVRFSLSSMEKHPKIFSLFWIDFAKTIKVMEPKIKILK